ncbi:TIGR02757 family protein [Campylobacter sp. JMF_04 NA10]|uniref:TIGR02757 family protein n=1 Tax=Campylobacter sp. JMF_04 NA10 TaxID=2983824 RepID=UPI0022E9FAE6|nr:TIGR02757 family protein [Campylobacter sp. JMF_04 NA10]
MQNKISKNLSGAEMKALLEYYSARSNTDENLFSAPDPLQVLKPLARAPHAPVIALICALFAYGNAGQIVKFLNSLNFDLLGSDEKTIKSALQGKKYRFQSERDVAEIFLTLRRLCECDIEKIILNGMKNGEIINGINALIAQIYELSEYRSAGYEFFFGKNFTTKPTSPYKRYNLFLRWMVRKSDIDLGLFSRISSSKLLIPLDTHTHKVSLALGLIDRKVYDFRAVSALSAKLREFDPHDPIKYDFALYRLGQSREIEELIKNLK